MGQVLNAFHSKTDQSPDETNLKIDNMKRKVELLHKGFVVHVKDIIDSDEDSNFLILKVVLNSSVNYTPVFGDIEIKITKQAVQRLKNELGKVM